MSQILAEQLRNNRKTAAPPTGGPCAPFINLHMDAGTLCWIYILLASAPYSSSSTRCFCWLMPQPSQLSMRRKYVSPRDPR